ncbi:1-acyl-sn-glycerol-3-phosphate acyltransferase delta [Lontra canadensis]|uniref:1-acyl-sn-glycerol-3-phosphate acyltransferase delta n=1 Tax=Lontra canadensis TaxID=76717 RepID=UPI0013F2D9DD|nr:1-acyl-sn-glycerol-3-phosphate acyltransferase delta [Lontra canadensis]
MAPERRRSAAYGTICLTTQNSLRESLGAELGCCGQGCGSASAHFPARDSLEHSVACTFSRSEVHFFIPTPARIVPELRSDSAVREGKQLDERQERTPRGMLVQGLREGEPTPGTNPISRRPGLPGEEMWWAWDLEDGKRKWTLSRVLGLFPLRKDSPAKTPSSSSLSSSGRSTSSSSGRSTADCPTASPAGSKVLAKKELAYVPIIGWMWYFTEMVFCTRKWEQDRKTVSQSLLHLRDYPEKYFFLIHCEGTRFTEKKHQISMQVAQAKGLPSLKYHLLPRTKGFAITVRSLRNVVSAVYDCTLNFRNNENPTLLGVLNGKKYHADLYVRRIPLEEVPEDEDECSAWLHKLYQEKDAFQEEYHRTGTFPETAMVPPRRPWTLLNWLFWASLLLYPFFRFLVNMVSSGSSLTLASFVLVFFVASMGVRWMIGVTEIDKGSAYGNIDSKQKRSD